MPKLSLTGFKDPVRRPRYIIWCLVVVMVLIAVMIPVLGVTSTRWFCANACHKVQDDTIIAYQHSSHKNISCMSCHMPVNANPVVFMMHKVEALGELYLTITNKFPLPLNAEDEVALTMKTEQCVQCHAPDTRVITPGPGMKIDHDKHFAKSIPCTICHNRIAHNENFDLTLKHPKTGEPNVKHTNFMKMTACFRCHDQEGTDNPTGACDACHTSEFTLKPASHNDPSFFPKGHADMAKSAEETAAEAMREAGLTTVTPEAKMEWAQPGSDSKESLGEKLVPVDAVFYCGTCHKQEFCMNCHGTPMPHSDEFKSPKDPKDPQGHPVQSAIIGKKCVMCHGDNSKTHFCDKCHHGKEVDYTFNVAQPWVNQHPKAVEKSGVQKCEQCHAVKFCSDCHTGRHVIPSSHRDPLWVHPATPTKSIYGQKPAAPSAKHAVAYQQSPEACKVCHSQGIDSPLCKGCHKLQLPHPKSFKQFHGTTGKKNPSVCKNCHGFKELCSNCHHVGSSNTVAWINVHGPSVEKNGTGTCFQKCHKTTDCQSCHTTRKVKPTSHKAATFLKRSGTALGDHAALWHKNASVCTFCHAGSPATLPNSPFCHNCHKISIPHKIDEGSKQKFDHKTGFQKGQLNRNTCLHCHEQKFCDNCHHPAGAQSSQKWLQYHPNVVKKSGSNGCLDPKEKGTGCHPESWCSSCHVNRAQQIKKLGF